LADAGRGFDISRDCRTSKPCAQHTG